MKRNLLLMLVLALCSIGANAQEWGPIEKAEAVSGHVYKIRNVQAAQRESYEYQYLAGGASWYSWATSTVLASEANSLSFTLTETEQGWTITRTTDNKYTFISGASPGTGHDGWGEMHVDQANQSALLHFFNFVKQTSGYYRIQAAPADTLYYDETKWWGWEIENEDKGNEYIEWAVYPCVNDETIFALDWELLDYTIYNEAVKLGELIEEVKNGEYADVLADDITAAETVYNNLNSTAEELQNAYTTLKVKVNYASIAGASEDNPKDATHLIVNNDFSTGNITGWTCTFVSGTSATNIGYQDNSSYTNGDITISQFIEAWAADGTTFNKNVNHRAIGDGKLSQLMPMLPAGKYRFTCDAIASYQDDADVEVTGVELFVSDGATEDKRVVSIHTGNCTPEHYKAVFVHTGGDVELGLRTNNTDANWICADNFTLTYYGETTDTPEKIFLDEAIENCEEAIPEPTEVYAKADIKQAYIDALDAAKSATSDYTTYKTNLENAFAPFQSSVNAYNQYLDKIHELQDEMSAQEYTAPEAGTLADYLMDDEIEPYEDMPNGSYCYIINNALLDDEQIAAEITWVTNLFQTVVTNSLKEGDDCTKMLVNANFADANGKGWTKGGNCINITWTGGLIPSEEGSIGCPVAESYHSTFDIYQVVEGAPNGVYALSLNGFCRLDGNESKVPAEVYMNNFATSLMSLQEGAIATEDAIDGTNAYQTTVTSAGNDCPALQNPIFVGCKRQSPYDGTDVASADGLGLVPNGMEGASVAFSAGRYNATVYGLVTDGKMTLGIRNLTSSTVWALWGNFKLTYVGKSNEAFQVVIGKYKNKLQEFLDENSDYMTTPAINAANDAITKANTAKTAEEANDALTDLNTQLTAVSANVEAVTAFQAENETLIALVEDPDADPSAYDALIDRIDDYESLTTEELLVLIEDMQAAEKTIKWSILVNYVAKATEDEPVDITNATITNPSFELSNTNGWTNDGSIAFQAQSNTAFAKTDTYYAERWHVSGTLNMNQTVTLPAGVYVLTADCYTSTADAFLYANEEEIAIPATDDATVQTPYSVEFIIGETTDVKIGAKATLTTSTWNCVDNFTLTTKGAVPTAINTIEEAKATTVNSLFNLAGQKLSAPQKGINIINGKKVLVK